MSKQDDLPSSIQVIKELVKELDFVEIEFIPKLLELLRSRIEAEQRISLQKMLQENNCDVLDILSCFLRISDPCSVTSSLDFEIALGALQIIGFLLGITLESQKITFYESSDYKQTLDFVLQHPSLIVHQLVRLLFQTLWNTSNYCENQDINTCTKVSLLCIYILDRFWKHDKDQFYNNLNCSKKSSRWYTTILFNLVFKVCVKPGPESRLLLLSPLIKLLESSVSLNVTAEFLCCIIPVLLKTRPYHFTESILPLEALQTQCETFVNAHKKSPFIGQESNRLEILSILCSYISKGINHSQRLILLASDLVNFLISNKSKNILIPINQKEKHTILYKFSSTALRSTLNSVSLVLSNVFLLEKNLKQLLDDFVYVNWIVFKEAMSSQINMLHSLQIEIPKTIKTISVDLSSENVLVTTLTFFKDIFYKYALFAQKRKTDFASKLAKVCLLVLKSAGDYKHSDKSSLNVSMKVAILIAKNWIQQYFERPDRWSDLALLFFPSRKVIINGYNNVGNTTSFIVKKKALPEIGDKVQALANKDHESNDEQPLYQVQKAVVEHIYDVCTAYSVQKSMCRNRVMSAVVHDPTEASLGFSDRNSRSAPTSIDKKKKVEIQSFISNELRKTLSSLSISADSPEESGSDELVDKLAKGLSALGFNIDSSEGIKIPNAKYLDLSSLRKSAKLAPLVSRQ